MTGFLAVPGARSPALAAYLLASRLAGPVGSLVVRRRLARGREHPERHAERLGHASLARPEGRLVWLHGASVGEAMSLLPLVDALGRAEPGLRCLVTTGTLTSAVRMAALLPPDALHQFVPVDTAAAVGRFLRHWRPDLAVWVESEFWPRLMVDTAARGVPMVLANARISAASANRWRRLPGMARRLVGLFGRIVAQDEASARRLVAMGAAPERVSVGGNLKTLLPPPCCDAAELDRLARAVAGRPVWLAASTHEPEERAVLEAHRRAAAELPGLLTLLVPRHPERADALAGWLAAEGLGVARRARGEMPGPEHGVWLGDTLGEMGLWYRLAPVAFVGGSLVPVGGHNPFEPAALGTAVLHGPHVANFAPAYAALDAAGGALPVASGEELAGAVLSLLPASGSARRAEMTEAARRVLVRDRPDADALARAALALVRAA